MSAFPPACHSVLFPLMSWLAHDGHPKPSLTLCHTDLWKPSPHLWQIQLILCLAPHDRELTSTEFVPTSNSLTRSGLLSFSKPRRYGPPLLAWLAHSGQALCLLLLSRGLALYSWSQSGHRKRNFSLLPKATSSAGLSPRHSAFNLQHMVILLYELFKSQCKRFSMWHKVPVKSDTCYHRAHQWSRRRRITSFEFWGRLATTCRSTKGHYRNSKAVR